MKLRFQEPIRLTVCALLGVAAACTEQPQLMQRSAVDLAPGDYALVGATVIPMTEPGRVLPDRTVLVRGGRIAAVAPRDELEVPPGFESLEAAGQYLIPGLTDMHVHLEHFTSPEVLKLFVANGVTTVRNMDGRPYLLEWRDSVGEGSMIGPAIYTAGPILDGDPPVLDDNTVVDDPAEARAAVRRQAEAGYDFVKVYTNLPPEAYRAVLAEARERGLPVAGHVPRQVAMTEVLASGQTSIEHLDGYDELIEAEDSPYRDGWHWSKLYLAMPADTAQVRDAAVASARAGVWNVPTLVQKEKIARPEVMQDWLEGARMAYVPGDVREHWKPQNRDPYSRRILEEMGEEELELLARGTRNRGMMVRALHEAGAGVLVGTDTPNPFVVPGFSVHEELRHFVRAGIRPDDALAAATSEAARFLGTLDEVATIEEGKRADLVLLRDDPLRTVGNTGEIAGVMVGGAWLSRADLDLLLEEVAAAYR